MEPDRRVVAVTLMLSFLLARAGAQAARREAVVLVPMPVAASWHDLAFLAALPAAAQLRDGAPLVLALSEDGAATPEQRDFLRRLHPGRLLWVGAAPPAGELEGVAVEHVAAAGGDAAAAALASHLPADPRVVVAAETDHAGCLAAAVLATRLRVPLLFTGAVAAPVATMTALAARRARQVLLVGEFDGRPPTFADAEVERLRSPADVARWLAAHRHPVDYLAAAVPADRTSGHARKVSLAAAALAAGRQGAVVTLGANGTPPATAAAAQAELATFRRQLGTTPSFLCLCGLPDVLPMPVVPTGGGVDTDPPSDLSYGDLDEDPFVELALARFVASDGPSGTLQAARTLAYPVLLSPSFTGKFAMAEWERCAAPAFENVGFAPPVIHPGGKPIDANSPLTSVAAIVHGSHCSWFQLGETVHHDSNVLLAPCLVESSGCSAAALDQDAEHRSVALRLLQNGAVAFVGNARRGVAQGELYRTEFWHAVLAGEPLGRAHRQALNRLQAAALAHGEQQRGLRRYQLFNAACYGDPAFVLHVPRPPRSAPARAELLGRTVTVHAPAAWWRVEEVVVPDWKYEAGPKIWSWRAAGVGAESCWDGEHRRNRDDLLFTVEARTKQRVQRVVAVSTPDAPLGFEGRWSIDEHADGTRSVYFAVRMIDFDMDAGLVRKQVDRLRFRLE